MVGHFSISLFDLSDDVVQARYFDRLEKYPGMGPTKDEFVNKNLTACILAGTDPECQFHKGKNVVHFVTWFCGAAIDCKRIGNRRAFHQAKDNIERWYIVVGR